MVQGAGNTYIGEIDLSTVPDLVTSHYPEDLAEIVYNNRYCKAYYIHNFHAAYGSGERGKGIFNLSSD